MARQVVSRKTPLSRSDIGRMTAKYASGSHDDLLFAAILATGFNGLNRLGELVWPDSRDLQDHRKCISFASLDLAADNFSFDLPGHKGNRFFDGDRVVILQRDDEGDALPIMRAYLDSRSALSSTCLRPQLFVKADGSIPTRSWFLRYLHLDFPPDYAGHSVRSGGATDLALRGIPDDIVQKVGRWTSDAFQVYIRKNPALLAALAGLARPPLRA